MTRSVAAGWGLLYVLEGSKLGAAVLSERIARELGDDVPRAFLGTDGLDRARWRRLCHQLDEHGGGPEVVDAARAAFAVHLEELVP